MNERGGRKHCQSWLGQPDRIHHRWRFNRRNSDSEEKHEPASDIDTAVVDSLKALDPEWPIKEGRGIDCSASSSNPIMEDAMGGGEDIAFHRR